MFKQYETYLEINLKDTGDTVIVVSFYFLFCLSLENIN